MLTTRPDRRKPPPGQFAGGGPFAVFVRPLLRGLVGVVSLRRMLKFRDSDVAI